MVIWALILPIYAGVSAYHRHRRNLIAWERLGPLHQPELQRGTAERPEGHDDGGAESLGVAHHFAVNVNLLNITFGNAQEPRRKFHLQHPCIVLKIGNRVEFTNRVHGSFKVEVGESIQLSGDTVPFFLPNDQPQALNIFLYIRKGSHQRDKLMAVGRMSIVSSIASRGQPADVQLRNRKGKVVGSMRVAISMEASLGMLEEGEFSLCRASICCKKSQEECCGPLVGLDEVAIVYSAESQPYLAVPDH